MTRLTKEQALLLLPAVIDNEATAQEEALFFEYIKYDPEVEREYFATLQVKRLLSDHLPKKPAPDYLKDRIMQQLHEHIESERLNQPKALPQTGMRKKSKESNRSSVFRIGVRYVAAASIILVLTLMVVQLLERSTGSIEDEFFVIENITAQHFSEMKGEYIEPHFATDSPSEAENYLMDHYGMEMTIPHLKNTQFAGVVLADFHNGMQVPLLEYIQEELGENIYIFAMDLRRLYETNEIRREKNAAESCTTQTDYFVNDIDGIHVVSWKWDDNWYSAVSNHNGHDLASLVIPLNQD